VLSNHDVDRIVSFSPADATSEPWLPQPKQWRDLTVEAESANAASMLGLYRDALRLRRAEPALGDGSMTWLPARDGVLAFGRDGGVTCVANLSPDPIGLPPDAEVLLASGPFADGLVPTDTTVWLRGSGT
jgi:alpha-glucosidase